MGESQEQRMARIEREDREQHKQLLKEAMTEWMGEHPALSREVVANAIKEWMDKQVMEVGRWTLRGILVIVIGAFFYYMAQHGGKP